jgi:hypothetical protein
VREVVDSARVHAFLRELGRASRGPARVYLTGGATMVLMVGSRPTTADIDLVFVPDRDELLRAIPSLKETLKINVELASPAHFIPALPGWEGRSVFVTREGQLDVFHYDPYSQALAKAERGFEKDLEDVRQLIAKGAVDPARARDLFQQIEPQLYRFPALDPARFRRHVDALFGESPAG